MRKNDNLTSPPRERVSVAIQGLDRSTPDDLCKDGTCEELHNLRYKDGAWRPVSELAQAGTYTPSMNVGNKKIVYKHPATGENHYIVEAVSNSVDRTRYTYLDVDITTSEEMTIATFDEQQKVSHFGNVLMFMGSSRSSFILQNKVYIQFNIADATPVIESSIHDYANSSDHGVWCFAVDKAVTGFNSNFSLSPFRWYTARSTSGQDILSWILMSYFVNIEEDTNICFAYKFAEKDDSGIITETPPASYLSSGWCGEHAFFAALRMADGTIINPSPLGVGISKNVFHDIEFTYKRINYCPLTDTSSKPEDIKTTNAYIAQTPYVPISSAFSLMKSASPLKYVQETLIASVPETINTDTIESIAIFSTRITPYFDFSKMSDFSSSKELLLLPRDVFASTDFLNDPFYLLAEKPLRDCDKVNGNLTLSITIDATRAKQITSQPTYTPLVSSDITYKGAIDYNNRLHIFDTSNSFSYLSVLDEFLQSGDATETIQLGAKIFSNNTSYIWWGKSVYGGIKDSHSLIISAHDYRIKEFYANIGTQTFRLPAQSITDHNFAFFVDNSDLYTRFKPISLPSTDYEAVDITPHDNTPLHEPNRLQVSSANNPFSLPFENSYAIGSASNRIIALQSAAIEMSDAKFGEFPLFAFTEEGIFALQAGSATLYASIIPINYDKIINPNTLAINGGIIYITERGVHLLAARGDKLTSEASTLISSPIHDKDGRPPLDFLRTCQIMWPKQHNEVIFHNPGNGGEIAYVFNLDAGYWSTRSLKGTKINTDEMIDGNTIYNLTHEDVSKTLTGAITTRPIKLGNVEFKRLETIIPRISTGSTSSIIQFRLLGSVDGSTYHPLRSANLHLEPTKVNPYVFRRTPFSAKYFKIMFGLYDMRGVPFSTAITHIDLEWYHKFHHRMR